MAVEEKAVNCRLPSQYPASFLEAGSASLVCPPESSASNAVHGHLGGKFAMRTVNKRGHEKWVKSFLRYTLMKIPVRETQQVFPQ